MNAEVKLAEGFQLKELYKVPAKQQGSWVAITKDQHGRLITADQYGGLYRVTLPEVKIEKIPVKVGGAHGLLWFQEKLYVSVSENKVVPQGIYTVSDSDGDGELDKVELIKKLKGGGEHGPHGFTPSPDGKWIYLVSGNHTALPEGIHHFHQTQKWGEDHLLPTQPDARGHARNCKAPGGWIARFTPDGKRWELFSQGYRNPYGIAFNPQGELFAYDADMEWDFGTPWYRPTRICHVTSGSEFGWRTGTGKWPSYYPDSCPPALNIGPGSPTGLIAGQGLKFPARYQRALFALDWTFATMYAIHLKPNGASYTAEKEEFLSSSGMPLADAVVGDDGNMYFLTGGRKSQSALYRIKYTGNESTAPAKTTPVHGLVNLRRQLDAKHIAPQLTDTALILKHLGHSDRAVRYSARVALEHMSLKLWKGRTTAHPATLVQYSIAIAHQGDAASARDALEKLSRVTFSDQTLSQQLDYLRAVSLLISRHGVGDAAPIYIKKLNRYYPSKESELNRELCRLLCALQAPDVVEKTLRLMASGAADTPPDWAVLAQRNKRYGADLLNMLKNMPSIQNLHYAYCLRVVKTPWTKGQRRQYFTWFQQASQKSGGQSYKGFIENIRKEALANATESEQKMIAAWKLAPVSTPMKNLPQAKGPGRNWQVDDVVSLMKTKPTTNLKNGKRMFHATLCSQCHQVSGEGGSSGPDLTRVAGRFKVRDIADAVIHPSKVISDQYQFSVITRKDGSSLTGKILVEKDAILIVATNPFDLSKTIEIPEGEIKSITKSPISPMPPALINSLNKQELADLMAYLMALK